ncbi:abscission/NoCut checkpoint regulator [Centruroides vittatus]|uniref:abscission/NoCut checkpoint regulator n=1 Tax=Centruroides vittatus TaxID=120091 RepID=UPI00350F0ABC
MSCYGCGATFGIFKKELGCNHCGFSFCGRCCSKKIIIPKLDPSKKQLVCKTCFEALSSVQSTEDVKDVKADSPPQALKKRMESLHNKSSKSGNMNEKDKIISEKLKKLKPQRSLDPVISQTELEERLAKLKGINPKVYTAPPILVYREQDNRSVVDKTEHLIEQCQHEVELESKEKSTDKEIEERLAKLRGETIEKKTVLPDEIPKDLLPKEENKEVDVDEVNRYLAEQTSKVELLAKKEIKELESDKELQNQLKKLKKKDKEVTATSDDENNDENDDEIADELVKKFVAEAALDSKLDETNYDKKLHQSSDSENENDDLPWCVICMANAQLRCFGCDKDLYCLRCFKECHESFEITDHPTEPFHPPIKQNVKLDI